MTLKLVFVAIFCFKLISADFHDLTHDFSDDTFYWPGTQSLIYTKIIESSKRGYWYSMREFCAGEHGGTHFDAPYHFYQNGWKVGEIPINRLITNGAIIDLSDEVKNLGSSTILNIQHLFNWQKSNWEFENGTVLLARFGWSENWYNKTKYAGLDSRGKLNFPGISPSAAEWIAKSGKFYGVGVDTPSVDSGSSTDFMVHRILSRSNIYLLENVKIPSKLLGKNFTLVVSPMKLKEGTGAPLRIYAIHK